MSLIKKDKMQNENPSNKNIDKNENGIDSIFKNPIKKVISDFPSVKDKTNNDIKLNDKILNNEKINSKNENNMNTKNKYINNTKKIQEVPIENLVLYDKDKYNEISSSFFRKVSSRFTSIFKSFVHRKCSFNLFTKTFKLFDKDNKMKESFIVENFKPHASDYIKDIDYTKKLFVDINKSEKDFSSKDFLYSMNLGGVNYSIDLYTNSSNDYFNWISNLAKIFNNYGVNNHTNTADEILKKDLEYIKSLELNTINKEIIVKKTDKNKEISKNKAKNIEKENRSLVENIIQIKEKDKPIIEQFDIIKSDNPNYKDFNSKKVNISKKYFREENNHIFVKNVEIDNTTINDKNTIKTEIIENNVHNQINKSLIDEEEKLKSSLDASTLVNDISKNNISLNNFSKLNETLINNKNVEKFSYFPGIENKVFRVDNLNLLVNKLVDDENTQDKPSFINLKNEFIVEKLNVTNNNDCSIFKLDNSFDKKEDINQIESNSNKIVNTIDENNNEKSFNKDNNNIGNLDSHETEGAEEDWFTTDEVFLGKNNRNINFKFDNS
jgi:hypothetical protein